MTEVECNVNNCHFNEKSSICGAEAIQVSNIDNSPDMEVGQLSDTAPSATSFQTQCVTFKSKNK